MRIFRFKSIPGLLDFNELRDKLKLKLSGISGAFMLPISSITITGLFLSLGGFISSWNASGTAASWWNKIGFGIKSIALPILSSFQLLLCLSFSLAFTKNNQGLSLWCSILSFLTFMYFQSAFIELKSANGAACACSSSSSCCSCKCCSQTCCNGANGICCVSCLICILSKSSFQVLFPGLGRDSIKGVIQNFFGIVTLNTSIFGPILLGGVLIPYICNNFSEVKLPQYLAYFSGKRLLPLLCVLSSIPISLLFLIFWPWIYFSLSKLGEYISKTNGVDSFLFGFIEKLLIPTGFHHIFASTFWYTPLGGELTHSLLNNNNGICDLKLCNHSSSTCITSLISQPEAASADLAIGHLLTPALSSPSLPISGDSLIGLTLISLPGNNINSSNKIFEFFSSKSLHIGRFTQGKFPIMQFALPCAALGIYASSNNKQKKEHSKKLIPGIGHSIILGITEPIEFSFMYSLPKLFYLFHTTMCGISFLSMRLLNAHIPTSFSGGLLEFLIYGVLSVQKGTAFWWWSIVGIVLGIIYFLVFYLTFRKYQNSSSEASDVNNDENEAKNIDNLNSSEGSLPQEILLFKQGLGGWDNVINYKNCASRLRYDIKDKTKIVESDLKKAGVLAIKWVGEAHIQLIVGPKAEELNSKLIKYSIQDKPSNE